MADSQSVRPPALPVFPSWPPSPVPPPTAVQPHPHFVPLPPFAPFPGYPASPAFASQQQRRPYYNLGSPPFPFHGSPGLAASHGPYGPPPRWHPHLPTGMVSPAQSPSGGTGHGTSGNGITPAHGVSTDYSMQFNRASPAGIARRDNLELSEQEEGISVIEKAILHSQKEGTVDVKQLVSQIRALVTQAEETVQKVGKLVRISPSIVEPHLVTCPFDITHRVPPEALFKHFLCCPSNPQPQENAQRLISSLRYPHATVPDRYEGSEAQGKTLDKTLDLQTLRLNKERNLSSVNPNSHVLVMEKLLKAGMKVEKDSVEGHSVVERRETEDKSKASVNNEVDVWGGRFYYKNSPAVFQAPLPTPHPAPPPVTQLQLTNAVGQQAKVKGTDAPESVSLMELGLGNLKECGDDLPPLLSSRFWFLLRETEAWKELPTRCSSLVLHAATGLGNIQKKVVLDWLLIQGPAYGIVIDSAMASHMLSLVNICLRSMQKAASTLIDHQTDLVRQRDIPPAPEVYSHAPGPAVKAKCAAGEQEMLHNVDASCPTHVKKESEPVLGPVGLGLKATENSLELGISLKPEGKLQALGDAKQIRNKPSKSMHEMVDGSVATLEVEAAIAAVHERAVIESFLRSLNYPNRSLRFQMIQDHDSVTTMAAIERQKRPNYRPVLEYDGLIWHRSRLEDKKKNKTREEILAEERDYKRRRTSYRGKKLKRNPTEVLHDLIGGHMEEILNAGGIGCLTKHAVDGPPSVESGKVESSRGSNPSSTFDLIKQEWVDDDPPHSTHTLLNAKDDRSWKDQIRGQSVRRDDWSNEHSSSRTSNSIDMNPQDSNYSRMEVTHNEHDEISRYRRDGSQGKSYRHDSHHSTEGHDKDDHSLHSRSARDHGRKNAGRWEDMSASNRSTGYHLGDRYGRDYERDQRHNRRH